MINFAKEPSSSRSARMLSFRYRDYTDRTGRHCLFIETALRFAPEIYHKVCVGGEPECLPLVDLWLVFHCSFLLAQVCVSHWWGGSLSCQAVLVKIGA